MLFCEKARKVQKEATATATTIQQQQQENNFKSKFKFILGVQIFPEKKMI
jgi:hypothetical protein